MDLGAAIRDAAGELGFERCGFSPARCIPRQRFLRDWMAEGRPGEMVYLRRRPGARIDPRHLFPWVKTVVSLGYPYAPATGRPADWRVSMRGSIAAYAGGRDYHEVLGEKLRRLARRVSDLGPGIETRAYVDTGPVLEREWARKAGLGWFGRNTMLLDPRAGSSFLIAELLTNLDLPPATTLSEDRCGTCRRCIDACPTGALGKDYRLDPRICLSYLTIEHHGTIPRRLRPRMGNWIFGCDICQEVCPWNERPDDQARFEHLNPSLLDVLGLNAAAFRARYAGTAITRAKRRGFLRNAAVALGNSGNPEAVPHLTRALEDQEPLVRGHAAWALGRLGGAAAIRALERARSRESGANPAVEDEILAALADARDRIGAGSLMMMPPPESS